jgi:lysyl-tRNA synthetase class 2
LAARRDALAALMAEGRQAYASGYAPDDDARSGALRARYESLGAGERADDIIAVAGRIVAIRDQGKLAFFVIRDNEGELQLFVRRDVLNEAAASGVEADGGEAADVAADAADVAADEKTAFDRAKDLHVGDWIWARGPVMRTRRGELSVEPSEIVLLSKSLRPLPEKFHGLSDTDLRYRQRYVDLIANPEVRRVFEQRSAIVAAIRAYLTAAGYLEVETPMLHPIPGGATARPFVTHHNALDTDLYLRIAPELYLKRLLVGGFERVFEINRSFRNEGIDTRHNPEFTMLEAYQAYGSMQSMMELTEGIIVSTSTTVLGTTLVNYQGTEVELGDGFTVATMSDLVSASVGRPVSVHSSVEELRGLCSEHSIKVEQAWGSGKLLAELFDELVEKTLIQPTFVTQYPAEISPLSRRNDDDPAYTDRFELFITGREFANAFSELNDPLDQRARFEAQAAARDAGDDEAMYIDEDYLRAQEYGMPPAGGMGLGIDRLVMLLTDSASIRDVLLFPQLKPEG